MRDVQAGTNNLGALIDAFVFGPAGFWLCCFLSANDQS